MATIDPIRTDEPVSVRDARRAIIRERASHAREQRRVEWAVLAVFLVGLALIWGTGLAP